MWKIRFLKSAWIFIVLLDLYCFGLFALVKPCDNFGRANFEVKANIPPLEKGKPFRYAETTVVCVFENKHNIKAYYFFWPLHRLLEVSGYWHFVKDPSVEPREN